MKRIHIFSGHYGSGKTEIAVSFAFFLKKVYNNLSIIDMDIVNPYFRTKDAEELLIKEGIGIITPQFANTNIDLPSLPANILSALQNKEMKVVLDVGGDDDGAIVLGRYHHSLSQDEVEHYFVFNANRPLTNDVENTIGLIRSIERASRQPVTKLINNTHLSDESNVNHLLEGQKILEEISDKTNIPIQYITGQQEILDELPGDLKELSFPIARRLSFPWE